MFYLRFVGKEGDEYNLSCEAYNLSPRGEWFFVTTEHVIAPGNTYERCFCVGDSRHAQTSEQRFWEAMFVMNETGKTLDRQRPGP